MMKAFDNIKTETNIEQDVLVNDSDSECDKAFAALGPGIPFKLKEVLNPEIFNPLKFVKDSGQKGVKLVNFTHSE